MTSGDAAAIISQLKQALAANPADAASAFSLAMALASLGEFAEASEYLQHTLRLRPGSVQAWENLALVLIRLNRLPDAEQCARRCIELAPGNAAGHVALGMAQYSGGRADEAATAFQNAVEIDPGDRTAQNNLGLIRAAQGRFEEAVACLANACAAPGPVEISHLVNLGAALMHLQRFAEAAAVFEQVVRAEAGHGFAWKSLGFIRQEQGRVAEAVECFRRACTEPVDPAVHSALVFATLFHPTMTDQQVFDEHLAWDRLHAPPRRRTTPHRNDRSADRRLRIGYLSPFFHDHAVMVFLEPILANHDHARFEVFCYSTSHTADATTARLKGYADVWREIGDLPEDRAAAQIEEDAIDILIDMAEHMAGQCACILARKPAPVQITWAYPYSTGNSAIDFRITDEITDPPGITERLNVESLIRLDGTYYGYRPPENCPDVSPLPLAGSGYVTFGSLNQLQKLSKGVVAVWSKILRQIAGSRLAMFAPGGAAENAHVLEWFSENQIESSRIEMLPRVSRRQFLEYFSRIDVALDAFPYTGHTTACESLYMGVPLVTLTGTAPHSRIASSVLSALGLQRLSARSPDEYVRIATELARDPNALQELRRSLRSILAASRLMDHQRVTRDIEAAYRRAWLETKRA